MKRRMDWIDWTLLAVLTAVETESLGWPVLLIAAGMAILLYVQQRRLFDPPTETDLEGMIMDSCPSLSGEQVRLLLANLRWRGLEVLRLRAPRWRWPDVETGSRYLDDLVHLDRSKFLRGRQD